MIDEPTSEAEMTRIYGPRYPDLAIKRARRLSRAEHGKAVLEAFRALQMRELMGDAPELGRHPCISGTVASDAEQILAAIRARQARELAKRKPRDPAAERKLYAQAMADKRDASRHS